MTVGVTGEHGRSSSYADRRGVAVITGQNEQHRLADGPAAASAAAEVKVGGPLGPGNDIPSVVGIGAEHEVIGRRTERFVAAVPDDEARRDGAVLQGPRVTVRGRGGERVAGAGLKTAIATTAVGAPVDGTEPPAMSLVVSRRAFREEPLDGAVIQRQCHFADAEAGAE